MPVQCFRNGREIKMSETCIATQGLSKDYVKATALSGLDLEVHSGEIFGLLGPNGAGKTTTCRILTTLARPSSGRAWVLGHDVVQKPVAAKRHMGLAPQHLNLDNELTVSQNLKLHGMLHGMNKRSTFYAIEQALGFTHLFERRDHKVKTLSGGLKRRLLIARALLHQPRVLFLDEPTAGLDAHSRREVWDLISHCNQKLKVTVFLTTHYLEEAEKLCHRVAILHHGKLIALDTVPKLLSANGQVVVEGVRGGPPPARFFGDREEAAAFAAQSGLDLAIRKSNLEDVFIKLTGERLQS